MKSPAPDDEDAETQDLEGPSPPGCHQLVTDARADLQDNSSTGSEDVSKSTSSGSGHVPYVHLSTGSAHGASASQCMDTAAGDTTDTEASSSSMRRSLSDYGLPAPANSVEAFPSLKDAVLRQLGLLNSPDSSSISSSEGLPEQDIENKFIAMSLAMKTDKLTLQSRMERQERQRDQAERAVTKEAANLQGALHKLNYLCKDSESIDILTNIKNEANSLIKAVERISASAETLGAVRQENRVSKAFDIVLAHTERLKRMYEKEHSELEETKKVLSKNKLTTCESVEESQSSTLRYRSGNQTITAGMSKGSKRRASIAAMIRPIGSTSSLDSSRSSPNSYGEGSNRSFSALRFGSISRRTSLAPSTSSSPGDPFSPSWDAGEHSDASEPFSGGAMDDITEVGESRSDGSIDKELAHEENNNQRRISMDKSVDRRLSQHELENKDSCDPPLPPLAEVDNSMEGEILYCFNTQLGPAVQTMQEWWSEVFREAVEALRERFWPLDTAHAVRMLRKLVVGLLLLGALFSLASIFVPVGGS